MTHVIVKQSLQIPYAFIYIYIYTRDEAERCISDKARIASVLNDF